MNAPAKPDPFEGLIARRVQPVALTRVSTDADGNEVRTTFECELHELPMGEFMPLRDRFTKGEITEGDFIQRVIGEALFLDGQKLTYERAQLLPTSVVKTLQPALEKLMGFDTSETPTTNEDGTKKKD